MVKHGQASSGNGAIADNLIAQVRELIKSLNIDPTVKGMKTSDFDSIAKAAAKEVSDTYAVPTYMPASGIKEILTKIMQASEGRADKDKSSDKAA